MGGPRLTDGDDTAEKRAGDMLDRNKIRPRNHTTEEGRRLLKGEEDLEYLQSFTIVLKVPMS